MGTAVQPLPVHSKSTARSHLIIQSVLLILSWREEDEECKEAPIE
jgi:hypothetical protein